MVSKHKGKKRKRKEREGGPIAIMAEGLPL
jgi:hypothetical protein